MAGVVTEMRANKLNDRVMRYIDLIKTEDPKQIERALRKLEQVDMSLDILTQTKCGKIVNQLKDDMGVGERAVSLVNKWKSIANTEADRMKKNGGYSSESPNSNSDASGRSPLTVRIKMGTTEHSNGRHYTAAKAIKNEPIAEPRPVKSEPVTESWSVKSEPFKDYEHSESSRHSKSKEVKRKLSNDFEAQLLQADRVPKKKKKRTDAEATRERIPDSEDVQRALGIDRASPTIHSYYANVSVQPMPSSSSAAAPSDELDLGMFKRKHRTKMYSGRKKADPGWTEVPSLIQICQRYFQNHIDLIDELGDVPFSLLACVFERCTTEQLERISEKNPQLHEEMNPIWERHVRKTWPNEKLRAGETWYACYKRLCREREEKLRVITAKINQRNVKSAANESTMRTQCTEVINPMSMQKKQIRYGLAPTGSTADARSVSQARREIFNSGSKSALMRLPGGSSC
ncbi:Transcription elongation factor B polypeptide 3 [Aphelenchoides bicaudatus]|nr:Transcription elongation factor B polypeptide 3 [Aphelenchoides bicaudatus]